MTTTRFAPRPTTTAGAPPAPQATGRGGLGSLLLDIGVPLASYYLLRKAGCGQVAAASASTPVSASAAGVADAGTLEAGS